ncbi:MAG TPA: hypothetical protein VFF78_00925 [Anaerolineaceae bacterium]|nr:hypothetical protein [Anaerolineaceae bacterium]
MTRKPKTDLPGSNNIQIGDISQSRAVAIGQGAQAIIHEAETSGDRERSLENFEQEKLARGIARLVGNLAQQAAQPSPASNPFPLRPLTSADAARFTGRQALLQKAFQLLEAPLTVMEGDPGLGKTSFLQAGLAPALIAQGHLPLVIPVSSSGGLTQRIKQSLIADLDKTPGLRDAPLQFFIQSIAHHLPAGKQVYLLLDPFETFFEMPNADQKRFVDELTQCLTDDTTCDHWMLCVRSEDLSRMTGLAEQLNQPFFPNTLKIRPLTRQEATEVLLVPLQAQGIPPAEDLLPVLLNDLGGEQIDPSQLQLVANTLYEKSGGKVWTLDFYCQTGGAVAIWEGYLDDWLKHNLDAPRRETAWTILSLVAEGHSGAVQEEQIQRGLEMWGLKASTGKELLPLLLKGGLLRHSEEGLILSSPGFYTRAHQWAHQRDLSALTRLEARRQTAHLRSSALRGVFSGGLGFSLAFLFNYTQTTPDALLCGYITLYRALPGGIAGLLLVLGLDVAVNDPRSRRWMPWLVASLAGGLSFGFALYFHASLRLPSISAENLISIIPAGLVGVAWGTLTGAAGLFCMRSFRPWWQTLLPAIILIGVLFGLLDGLAGAFGPGITFGKFLAGIVMPGFVLLAALFGRHPADNF